MHKDNLREGRKNLPLKHHSSRGKPTRNSGNFTRGGQLIGHEWSMFFAAAKIPLLIWLVISVVVYWIMLAAVMGPHEFQLCAWRIGSALWTWMDLSPLKPMNIILADNSPRQVPIGYIPFVPDVQLAVAKALHALIGSLLSGTLLSMPLAMWFIRVANRHGKEILEERHERGAMLVELPLLVTDILAHNAREFEKAVGKLFKGLTPRQVRALPFAARKEAGLHHPYSLGGVPYPYGLEQSHTIIIGTTGSGKTTEMRSLVAEMRQRGDSAVIFDLTGSFIESFYNEKTDIILNPGDTRCPSWSLFEDCTTEAEFTAASQALIPHDGGGGDPFWITAARMLFIQMCLKLQEHGLTTNKALADNLIKTDLKRVNKILRNTAAEPLTSPSAARMAESIRSVYAANAQALNSLPDDGEFFSIREWVREENKPGSILFVSARYVDLPLYKTLLTLFLDIAVNTLMTLPRTGSLRTWFMFDEVGALHRLPAIENGLQTARGYGGALVLGLHSFARLQAVYGREGAENIASLAGSKMILKTADRKTAEICAEFIGHREVRQMDEAYSYGYNNLRDAATLTPKKEIAPLVIPDDITNLPSLHGFIKFPDGFPAARVEIKWRDYKQVAQGFILREINSLKPSGANSAPGASKRNHPPASGTSGDGGHENGDPKQRTDKDIASDKQITRNGVQRAPRLRPVNQGEFNLVSDAPKLEAEREQDHGSAARHDETLRQTTDMGRIEQSIDDSGRPDPTLGRPGIIARPQVGDMEERQAAMQRELHTDYGDERSVDNAIDMDGD
jgi:type IV conjugative transfer system coupling protein TraD